MEGRAPGFLSLSTANVGARSMLVEDGLLCGKRGSRGGPGESVWHSQLGPWHLGIRFALYQRTPLLLKEWSPSEKPYCKSLHTPYQTIYCLPRLLTASLPVIQPLSLETYIFPPF